MALATRARCLPKDVTQNLRKRYEEMIESYMEFFEMTKTEMKSLSLNICFSVNQEEEDDDLVVTLAEAVR